MKDKIIAILNKAGENQINLQSQNAVEMLADEIYEAVSSINVTPVLDFAPYNYGENDAETISK